METRAALARLRAEAGEPDGFPGEMIRVRVGDVWAALAEIERLRAALHAIEWLELPEIMRETARSALVED